MKEYDSKLWVCNHMVEDEFLCGEYICELNMLTIDDGQLLNRAKNSEIHRKYMEELSFEDERHFYMEVQRGVPIKTVIEYLEVELKNNKYNPLSRRLAVLKALDSEIGGDLRVTSRIGVKASTQESEVEKEVARKKGFYVP